MNAVIEILASIHILTYILARVGTLHQIFLIWKSKNRNKAGKGINTAQLSLRYRGNAALLFLSMILWGLSLSPVDWVVAISRCFSLVMFLIIVRELWIDRQDRNAKYWFFGCISLMAIATAVIIFQWEWFKSLSSLLGILTVLFSFNLVVGAYDKVKKIIKAKSPGKQSLVEMSFQLTKDLSGMIYGLLVGFDKMWPLVLTLFLIAAIRIVNIAVHLYYSRKKTAVQNNLIKTNKSYLPKNYVVKEKVSSSSKAFKSKSLR